MDGCSGSSTLILASRKAPTCRHWQRSPRRLQPEQVGFISSPVHQHRAYSTKHAKRTFPTAPAAVHTACAGALAGDGNWDWARRGLGLCRIHIGIYRDKGLVTWTNTEAAGVVYTVQQGDNCLRGEAEERIAGLGSVKRSGDRAKSGDDKLNLTAKCNSN